MTLLRVPRVERFARIFLVLPAMLFLVYGTLALVMNSSFTAPIVDLIVGWRFSGEMSWERSSWGPEPWDVRVLNVRLTDALAEEVVYVESLEIDDFLYLGLVNDHISALAGRIKRPTVRLKERPHQFKLRQLEWNIAELFQPPHVNLDDGLPLPPITIELMNLSLVDGAVTVEMGITKQRARGIEIQQGRFGFELQRKWMHMGADKIEFTDGRSIIWLRDLEKLPPKDRIFREQDAPIERTLDYPLKAFGIKSFWWLGDQFGAGQIQGTTFQSDQVVIQDGMLSIIKGGTPEMSGRVYADIKSLKPYINPWKIDEFIKGEVKAQLDLYGPVSDPCARNLEASGQLFLPASISTRFDLKLSKNRQDLLSLSSLRVWSNVGDIDAIGTLKLNTLRGLFKLNLNSITWAGFTEIPMAWKPWGVEAKGGLTLKVRPHSEHTLEIGAELKSDLQGPAPLSLDARATLTGPQLDIHEAHLALGDRVRSKNQRKRFRKSSYIDALVRAHLNLDDQSLIMNMNSELSLSTHMLPPLVLPVQGMASIQLSAKGPFKNLQFKGNLNGRRLSGQMNDFNWALTRVKVPFEVSPKAIFLNGFSFEGPSGSMEGSLKAPLEHLDRVQGWTLIHSLPLDLSPIQIPMSAQLQGVACTTGQGCTSYFKQHPISQRALEDDCLKTLLSRLDRGFKKWDIPPLELCITGKEIQYEQFSLNEMGLSARWESKEKKALLRRIRMWKGPRLLLDAEGQIDLKAQQFQSEAKLLDFPLQLVQLFTSNPPPELKTLYGVVDGELILGGSFSRPMGRGELTAKNISFKLSKFTPFLPVNLGIANLRFDLSKTGLNAQGHLGRQLWLSASIPFEQQSEKIAHIGLDLYDLPISAISAIPQGEIGYQAQLKQLNSDLQESTGLLPFSLSDPNDEFRVLAIGKESYCALSELKLPQSTLVMLALQGHFDLSFSLDTSTFMPNLNIDLEGIRFEYWMRDQLAALAQLNSSKPQHENKNTCHHLCGSQARCPTIAINNESTAHVAFKSLSTPFDYLYLNPEPSLSLPASQQIIEKQELWVKSWRPKEYIKLAPLKFVGPYHELDLQFALMNQQLTAGLKGSSQFSVLGLFLDGLFQKLEGEFDVFLQAQGLLQSPKIEGNVRLIEIAMLSPRSQIIGDLRLTSPMMLSITPIEEGGLQVVLPTGEQGVTFLRNEGEITLNEMSIILPKLEFQKLSVGFSARQLEAKLPSFGRFTTQLKGMRFVMDRSESIISPDLLLEGEVDLLRGLYTADVVSTDEINQGVRNNLTGRTAVETLSVFDRSPILKRLKLNLFIHGEDDLIVRNQIGGVIKLNLGVALELNVKGYLYALPSDPLDMQLQLSGEINTMDDSTITYANNTFDVVDGRVSFGGSLKGASQSSNFMNAELEATHTFRIPRQSLSRQQVTFDRTFGSDLIDEEVTLKANVLMPTKESRPQVELDLSSQSGASKIEVATLVITGRYPNNLNTAASTQPATEVLLAPILNLIERPLEDSLGMNLSLTPETGGGGLFIDLNKSFSRRLRLYARTPIGEGDDDSPQSFGVEYKLNNFLSSELTREQINQSNATSGRLRLRLSWE